MDWMALTCSRSDLTFCMPHASLHSSFFSSFSLHSSFQFAFIYIIACWFGVMLKGVLVLYLVLKATIHFGYIGRAIDRFVHISLLILVEFTG